MYRYATVLGAVKRGVPAAVSCPCPRAVWAAASCARISRPKGRNLAPPATGPPCVSISAAGPHSTAPADSLAAGRPAHGRRHAERATTGVEIEFLGRENEKPQAVGAHCT